MKYEEIHSSSYLTKKTLPQLKDNFSYNIYTSINLIIIYFVT